MEDESDNLTSLEPKIRTVWPPMPVGFVEPVSKKPARKAGHPVLTVIAVVFFTLWAFLAGYVAGTGHKDYSESLVSNTANALFDLALWSVPILYWFSVLKSQWRLLRGEPTAIKKIMFTASCVVLFAIYGSGLWISLTCLIYRAAASDTVY